MTDDRIEREKPGAARVVEPRMHVIERIADPGRIGVALMAGEFLHRAVADHERANLLAEGQKCLEGRDVAVIVGDEPGGIEMIERVVLRRSGGNRGEHFPVAIEVIAGQ